MRVLEGFVQITEVECDSYSSIWFGNKYRIGEPCDRAIMLFNNTLLFHASNDFIKVLL